MILLFDIISGSLSLLSPPLLFTVTPPVPAGKARFCTCHILLSHTPSLSTPTYVLREINSKDVVDRPPPHSLPCQWLAATSFLSSPSESEFSESNGERWQGRNGNDNGIGRIVMMSEPTSPSQSLPPSLSLSPKRRETRQSGCQSIRTQ
jgi:hypothetical protein